MKKTSETTFMTHNYFLTINRTVDGKIEPKVSYSVGVKDRENGTHEWFLMDESFSDALTFFDAMAELKEVMIKEIVD